VKIDVKWDKPIRLKDGAKFNRIYVCSIDRIPAKPGVYIFARTFGKSVAPLYVGQALKLKNRIDGQFNNLRLMMGLKQADNGRRILLVGRLNLHRGQQKKKVLDIVESALIKHALAGGHDLLNQQGTKTKVHVIKSEGNGWSRKAVPLKIFAERKKGA
jgi:hypothetical protein